MKRHFLLALVTAGLVACSSSSSGTPSTPIDSGETGSANDSGPGDTGAIDDATLDGGTNDDATIDSTVDDGAIDAVAEVSTDTGTSPPIYCGHPADCAAGSICGADGTCHAGPCSASNACIFGFTCGSGGTCAGGANGCDRDADCASGARCIAGPSGGGTCTAAANQCFDEAQCATGERCVGGTCVLGCASNGDCRDGFACDTARGVCTVASKACTITNDCATPSLVCVAGACVPRSTGGACTNPGDVWTENGCIPNQAATFTCANEGTLGGACAAGSICLHHVCWISCDAPNQNACASQPVLNTCKPVTSGSSTFNVCGTAQNLGSQCGPGANDQTCSGAAVCIDGFCR